MSNKSNNQGRAFEFACIKTLGAEISKYRTVTIVHNNSYEAAHRSWQAINNSLQNTLKLAACSAVKTIFELEPLIIEDGNDELSLKIQTDKEGIKGDVRDILIIRRGIHWEIGLSIKHNNFAAKHSRLSRRSDFGFKWYGVSCSQEYWNSVNPVFANLQKEKTKGTYWEDLPNKMDDVYVPLLKAFMREISLQSGKDATIPRKLVEYLLGKYDFYKVISKDKQRITQIQSFNLHGTLNKATPANNPIIQIPIASLPTRIAHFDFVPDSKTTVEMFMDGGWQFTFRLHNGEDKVAPSLKFDVQIVGMPAAIISINCRWVNSIIND